MHPYAYILICNYFTILKRTMDKLMVRIIKNNFLHVCSWSKNHHYEIMPNYLFLVCFPFLREGRQAYEITMLSLYDILSALKPVDQFSRYLVWILWDWRPIHHHISNFLQSVIREHGGHNKLWDQSSTANTCFMLLKWWMVIDF